MPINQESGYAKKVADFKIIVSAVESYGAAYNPPMEVIKLANLQKAAADSTLALEALNSQLALQKDTSQRRNVAFEPLKKLSTRIFAFLKALNLSNQQIEGFENQHRKLQGRRAKPVKDETADATGNMPVHISNAQLGYDDLVDNFDKLIKQAEIVPEYLPNEPELQIAQLQALHADLKQKNDAVIKVNTDIFNSRQLRNDILFKDKVGLCDLSLAVKNYIKALYGSSDPKYRVISKIRMKKT